MSEHLVQIRTALISVSDKTGVDGLAVFLSGLGVKIISTGGTAKALRDVGVPVVDIVQYTAYPECFNGRLKTLHPKVHGGLLYLRGNPEHEETARRLEIEPIDLVVVNLYPFEETIDEPDVTDEKAVENIDIGGPGMLRSAAKNHRSVVVASNPDQYPEIEKQMVEYGGATSFELRRFLAAEAFWHMCQYDYMIAEYLTKTRGY